MVDERDKARARLGLPPVTPAPLYNYNPLPQSPLSPVKVDRNAAKEAEAIRVVGKEEVERRGGVNSQGYFNDVPASQQLTAEEYKSVTKKDGTIDSEAALAILNKKTGGNLSLTGGAGTGTGTGTADANAAEKAKQDAAAEAERLRRAGQSAYDILLAEFNQYGLGALVEPLKSLIQSGPSSAELTLALRATDAYQKRFAANKSRVSAGLSALNEAEYIRLEDQYQNIMRNYGLPASYYAKDTTGRQEGFEKLIGFDVSATELEDRVLTAQSRVINAAPEVTTALKQFYPDITNGDILAYTLDPTKGLSEIKRKVTAAEIGGAALGSKLGTSAVRAEELARYGVTAESAQKGYSAIGGGLERGRQLSSIYQEPAYTQAIAEEEIFNLPGQTQAGEKRKKIIGLEKATFGGQTGVTSGALSQNRAGSY